jgi:hypothetical protein
LLGVAALVRKCRLFSDLGLFIGQECDFMRGSASPKTDNVSVGPSQRPLGSGVTIRHALLCFLWFGLTTVGLAAMALIGSFAVGASLAVYALHGLIAEALGLRVDSKGIVAPRRLSASLPFLILWRERIPLASISNLTSMPKSWAGECAIVVAKSAARRPVVLPNREKRLLFFHLLTQLRPTLSIHRGR